ncbi:head decoration protein [Candidatus Pacearchaeota archaeon]|nr:head decoration protein [Candidatus Pacearchaeota archaeon]
MAESLGLNTETFAYDNLFAGSNVLPVSQPITLITGQNLVRGALLGRITASGKWNLSLLAAVDGSQVPRAILAKDTDATSADVETASYETGEYNQNGLTFGTGHTVANTKDALRDLNIHLKDPVDVDGQ